MSPATFVWANLRRRPAHALLLLAAVTFAFMLLGLALGIAVGIQRAALEHGAAVQPSVLVVAVGISAIGMMLILLLTTNAVAHSIRLRTHELALMSALGFSSRYVLVLLVAESASLCLAGTALGLLGGKVVFAASVAAMPPLAVFPPPIYTMTVVATALVLGLAVATFGVLIPAFRLGRADVAVLMRAHAPVPKAAGNATPVESAAYGARPRSEGSAREHRGRRSADFLLLRQILVTTRLGLSTLPLRLKGALLIVVSVATVVFVLVLILSTGEGVRVSLLSSGDLSRVVLRSSASVLLDEGKIPEGLTEMIRGAPGIAQASDGSPLIQEEIFDWVSLEKRNNGKSGYAVVAGVGPHWPQMTPEFSLLSGRLPQQGRRELIAGVLAAQKFSALDSGTVQFKGETWRVVGTFTTRGWWDGYLAADATDLRTVAGLDAGSALRVRLTSPEAFDDFRDAVTAMLPPSVVLEREPDHYASFWRRVPKHLAYMALVIAALIGAGASLGTALVMHDALEDRRREIATLRVMGFDAKAVAASVLAEALCLSLVGSLIGAGLVWLWLDGLLYNGAWNVFRMTVDSVLFGLGILWGLGIALGGTIPLILRTLKQSDLDSIRDLGTALRTSMAISAPMPLPRRCCMPATAP